METYAWYAQLIKPSWAPPSWVFGPVWSVLYIIIALSFGAAIVLFVRKRISLRTITPFVLNIIFNAAFTPIQFGLRNNVLALIDILLVLGTIIWAIIAIYPHKKWIAYAQVPYVLWVSFATVLQCAITFLNW